MESTERVAKTYSIRFGKPLPGGARRASRILLSPSMTARRAMQVVGEAVSHDIGYNLRVVLTTGADPLAVHQARVHLRRLRVLLSASHAELKPKPVRTVRRRAKAHMRLLAPVRNLDVQLSQLGDVSRHAQHLADIRQLEAKTLLEKLSEVKPVIHDARTWTRFVRRNWSSDQEGVRSLANRTIKQALMDLHAYGPLESLLDTPGQHHDFRNDLKCLRYLTDIFRSLYPRWQVRRIRAQIKALQDDLGTINDVEEARLTGVDTLLYPDGWREAAHHARLNALENWQSIKHGIPPLLRQSDR